ncbi:MAG TPA: dCTP deaminase [Solirubrobacteraceae bacterium]|jgi:deoxycytidine triphosphate deaminase
MYLTDRDIRVLSDEMGLTGPNPEHPFEPDRQIQPCSIDLRISNVFWKPRRRRRLWRRILGREIVIDLRRSNIHDLDALRDWKRVEVNEGQHVTLKPGHMIMGRVYERFKMPVSCAGKIEGRSSFARLGLAIHCTGDFINPGWEGYMPLQLTNLGPYPLRLAPYFSICQLMLVRLSGEPEKSYGDENLRSKYINDDGGPSLWWRDARVEQLQKRLGSSNATEAIRQQIVDRVRFENTAVIARLQRDLDHKRVNQIENADQVLGDFAGREKRRRLTDNVFLALPLLLGATALAGIFAPFGVWLVVFVVLFVASLIPAFLAFERRDDGYLGADKARAVEERPDHQA